MSSDYYQRQADSERKRLEGHMKRRADDEARVSRAEDAALRAEVAAGKASSASMVSSKLREAQRKREEANKAREASARASKAISDSQRKIHDSERKAAEERQREARRSAERQRQDAERQRREEQRAQAARDRAAQAQVKNLETRTRDLEEKLRLARLAAPREITVLFMAGAIEEGRQRPLHLDREIREIDQKLRASEYREQVRFETTQATQVRDVIDALNRYDPDVVHFSGHSNEQALVFEGANGQPHVLDSQSFALLLQAARKPIRLVVFNSCLSGDQAEMATEYVEAAIGTRQPIDDESAKHFAGQLYGSLASGNSLANAFQQACAHAVVVAANDAGQPQLYTAAGIDPAQLVLVAP